MTVYVDKVRMNGEPVDRKLSAGSFEYENGVWIDKSKSAAHTLSILTWLQQQNEDIYLHNFYDYEIVEGEDSGPSYEIVPFNYSKMYGFFLVEFTTTDLRDKFMYQFEDDLAHRGTAYPILLPTGYERPDELLSADIPNLFVRFPKGAKPQVYYHNLEPVWFAESPRTIARNLGFNIDHGKLNNLVSFADGSLDLWYYISLLPAHLRSTPIADEWINFILGPMAATLKVMGVGFQKREQVVSAPGLLVMFEAMELNLIPPGKRKELYEALYLRFNAEYRDKLKEDVSSLEAAREIFYTILADCVESIFSEAGANELTDMIKKVLVENPKQAEEAKTNPKIVGFLMGAVMRGSPTKLDPNTVRAAIISLLDE